MNDLSCKAKQSKSGGPDLSTTTEIFLKCSVFTSLGYTLKPLP